MYIYIYKATGLVLVGLFWSLVCVYTLCSVHGHNCRIGDKLYLRGSTTQLVCFTFRGHGKTWKPTLRPM